MTSFAYDRYKTDIAHIFSEENKLRIQLMIEKELAYANYKTGKIPEEAYKEIADVCNGNQVKLYRVQEIEEETHHDLMSVVLAISEQCTTYGGYVHLGATSNDIQDTVLGYQLQEAKTIILTHVQLVVNELVRLAQTHKDIVCIGRTHGQQAIPITYGFKFSNFVNELELAKENLDQCKVNYGKISGAVGNYASYGTQEIENIVLEGLNLKKLPITTQVIPRIIHSKFIFALGTISATIERIAKEIRNLSRTEIGEVSESFGKKQVGSSTMPHKRNPHKSEQISGIAKYIRNMVSIELENIPLEHERDLTNSSSERLIIPQTVTLTDYIILRMQTVLKGLTLNYDNIKRNLHLTQGRVNAEQLMIELSTKIGRQKAHEILNRLASMQGDYISLVINSEISKYLSEKRIKELLNPENYTGLSTEIVNDFLARYHLPTTYAEAGVDIVKESEDIDVIGNWVKKTFEFASTGMNFGHYANSISVGDYELGLSTDGVGSKLIVAELANKYDTIGIDCVAMNVNDLLCLGFKPLAFVDYIATESSLGLKKSDEIAKGLYDGCKQSNIPILGGEMATLPDIIKGFDLAGTALGIKQAGTLIDGSKIEVGDSIIGLESNGIHSNGFTLARKVLFSKYGISHVLNSNISLGDELLKPTRIYTKEILAVIDKMDVKGIAHITGSGFKKLLRLGENGYQITKIPNLMEIFSLIQKEGNIPWKEMFTTFNMGIGMIIVVNPESVESTLTILKESSEAWVIGKIIKEKKVVIDPYNIEIT